MFLYRGSRAPGTGSSVANWFDVSAMVEEASNLTYIKLFPVVGFQCRDFGTESGVAEKMGTVHHFDLQLLL